MPTKIFDIAIEDVPDTIPVSDPYTHALFMLRRTGVPIGKLTLPVVRNHVDPEELRAQIRTNWASDTARSRPEYVPLPSNPVSATIVICTRNRPDDVRSCLGALRFLAEAGQDILVIDNNPSTDETQDVVARFPVRYVREPQPGLNNARNRALQECTSEIVAFIDDDAIADPHWLDGLREPFSDPRVQCVTGLTMPLELETEAQEMFEDLVGFSRRGFRRRVFRSPPHPALATGPIGAGANMAVRRSVSTKIGTFDAALDATKDSPSGGDHEYFTRILRHGYHIVYTPQALNWHRHRRTYQELRATMRNYGLGVYAAWTRTLIEDRNLAVFRHAWAWFYHEQAPNLIRATFKPDPKRPADLFWAELSGCLAGPSGYLKTRRMRQTLDA